MVVTSRARETQRACWMEPELRRHCREKDLEGGDCVLAGIKHRYQLVHADEFEQ